MRLRAAEAVFGSVTVSTPRLNEASALSGSTPGGSGIVRRNEPYDCSRR